MLYNEPHPLETKVLTRRFGLQNSASIETYLATEGYQAFEKAAGMKPEQIIEEVKISNLRGIPRRHEVELRAAHVAQAEVHRSECR
jgi:NADH-quinone oxidoreductase subunit F